MIPFEKLDEVYETWKEEKGAPPKYLHLSEDRFLDLLATGKVKCYNDGNYYYRVHTRIMKWPNEYLEGFTQMDEQFNQLKSGEIDLV